MKRLTGHLKAYNPDKPDIITLVVSTIEPDRDGEIVLPSALAAAVAGYKRAPGLFWHHPLMYATPPDPRVCVGKGIDFRSDAEKTEVDFRLMTKSNEWAVQLRDLAAEDFPMGVSIGYRDLAVVTRNSPRSEIDALPESARTNLLAGAVSVVTTKVDWFETSLVTTGSNPGGLVQALKSAGGRAELARLLRELGEELPQETPSGKAVSPMKTPESETSPATPPAAPQAPSLHAKANHAHADLAARLRAAANTLEDSRWMDREVADKCETYRTVCDTMDEIREKINKLMGEVAPGAVAGEATDEITMAAKAGDGKFKALPKAKRDKMDLAHNHVKAAVTSCNAACDHLKELLDEAVTQVEDAAAASAASAKAVTPPDVPAPDVDALLRSTVAGLFRGE